jgi:hypothetical protein
MSEAFSAQDLNYGIVVLLNSRPDMLSDAVSAQTITIGIRNMLYGIDTSSPTGLARYTWYGTYLLTDLALVGLIAYAVFATFRLLRWLKSFSRTAKGSVVTSSLYAGLDLLAGIIVLLLPLVLTGYSWPAFAFSYIELTIPVFPAAVILCTAGLVRITVLLWKKPGTSMDSASPTGIAYEIRIKGHLNEQWSEWFDGLTICNLENGEGILLGKVIDQAALQGILTRIGDLNLTLISVNPIIAEG